MEVKLTKLEKVARSFIQHYNEKKYWKYREIVVNFRGGALYAVFIVNFFFCTLNIMTHLMEHL